MTKAVRESRPEVGSSRRRTLGLQIISTAIDVRFFYPPEIVAKIFMAGPPTTTSRHFDSLNFETISVNLCSLAYGSLIARSMAKFKVYRTVKVWKRWSVCVA